MRPFKFEPYHGVWAWLFLAWMVCYIDRSITGPVVSWMMINDVGFLAEVPMEHAIGGMIGSMFFAGYMLTQYPAGFLGDRYGRRWMLVISTAWAGVTTLASAFTRSLTGFVAMRVLTGLGEGAYYSNDRAVIDEVTPKEKKGLAMGVVFVGLALGLTAATVLTPWMIDIFSEIWGKDVAWTAPFLVFAPITMVVSLGLKKVLSPEKERGTKLWRPLASLILISSVLLGAIMVVFQTTLLLGWGGVEQTIAIVLLASTLVYLIYLRLGRVSAPVLKDRRLLMMYISAIPILYTLWFFGFWSILVVSESSSIGIAGSAMYAGLFGVASIIGYPLGGKICDISMARGKGRGRVYVSICLAVGALVFVLAIGVSEGSVGLKGIASLLFIIGVLFSALQTAHMTMTSDLAPKGMMAQTFGMWNLVAEFGALLSPVLSGALRDWTGSWFVPTIVVSILLVVSAAIVFLVDEGGPR
ncbi:MAG: MFS transporter [Methanomassiliicoccales archaeon]|nr:MAG: MFS transporter [Methanomassiliicoccales archaeon]